MAVELKTKSGRSPRKDDLARVELQVRQRVAQGAWRQGALLPSRRVLAEEFGVDLNTIQRALAPLLSDGTLRAEGGRGTFVGDASRAAALRGVDIAAPVRARTIGITAFLNEDNAAAGLEPPATAVVLRAIEENVRKGGGKAVVLNRWSDRLPEMRVADAVRRLLNDGVDGVVVVDVYTHAVVLADLLSMPDIAQAPVVYVSNMGYYVPCAHVYFDNRDAGYRAAAILIDAGYRNIRFLTPYAAEWQNIRSEGARIACENRTNVQFELVPPVGTIDLYGDSKDAMVAAFLDEVADSNPKDVGFIAAHDLIARSFMNAAERSGLVAGRDYGLVGFDDDVFAMARGLTTMRPPFEEMGAEAASILLADNPYGWNRVSSLRAQAVVRQTHLKNRTHDN